MKNSFEDFKSEVYRRRDVKQKQAKQLRKRVLTLAIPLVLVIGIIGFSPAFFPAMEKCNNAVREDSMESKPEITPLSYDVAITTKNETITLSKEDADSVLFILMRGDDALCDKEAVEESATEKPVDPNTQGIASSLLRITLTDESGRNIQYQLEGNLLLRLDTGEERVLTESQVSSIISVTDTY